MYILVKVYCLRVYRFPALQVLWPNYEWFFSVTGALEEEGGACSEQGGACSEKAGEAGDEGVCHYTGEGEAKEET